MNKIRRNIAFVSISIITLFSAISVNAATVIPSDYMVAGSIGDTWTYENLDGTQLTWTLSEVTSGPNAGRLEKGNNDSGIVYDLTGNVLTIYEYDKTPINPPFGLSFPEVGLGQVVSPDPDPTSSDRYLFTYIPSLTVQAGTFNDVLAFVWLDTNFSANVANTQLGLDPLITAGVTDVEYLTRDIGLLKYQGIAASTGLSDGFGYELVSTTVVPIPAALPLLLSGLFGISLLGRNKKKRN